MSSAAEMNGWMHRQILDDRNLAEATIKRYFPSVAIAEVARSGHRAGRVLHGGDALGALDRLADCEAKLLILEEHEGVEASGLWACRTCLTRRDDYPEEWERVPWPCKTYRLIAHGLRHRDGFDPAWVPAEMF